jgi:SAM-dependent methyltransferase
MITSLQIGSGKADEKYRSPEWVNIDLVRHKPRGHFVVADGCALPFPSGIFQEIHAIHVLEHIQRGEKDEDGNYVSHMQFAREIARVMHPGGEAWIEVPDFVEGMRLMLRAADAQDHEGVRIRIVGAFGKGRHAGDRHDWGFTPGYLWSLFRQVGLECKRSYDMISGHHRQEPVILMRAWHG